VSGLVIAGAPGSGKSGAAVLLILAALAHRELVDDAARRKQEAIRGRLSSCVLNPQFKGVITSAWTLHRPLLRCPFPSVNVSRPALRVPENWTSLKLYSIM
jgi:hypothetical protein